MKNHNSATIIVFLGILILASVEASYRCPSVSISDSLLLDVQKFVNYSWGHPLMEKYEEKKGHTLWRVNIHTAPYYDSSRSNYYAIFDTSKRLVNVQEKVGANVYKNCEKF